MTHLASLDPGPGTASEVPLAARPRLSDAEGVLAAALRLVTAIDENAPAPRLSLSFSDTRQPTPAQARSALPPLLRAYGFGPEVEQWLEAALPGATGLEASFTLAVPGETAAAWLEAPVEHDPRFGRVYTAVSVAVQQAMRRWLPYVYFSDLARYDDRPRALPLVVYQCTLPFRTKARNEFAYDIMSADSVAVARRSTVWALAAEIHRIERILAVTGRSATARFYRPSRRAAILASIQRQPRFFHALLLADAFFVDNLIGLGVMAGQLRHRLERDPQRAVREILRFAGEIATLFRRKLRRLYGGQNCAHFGSLLLVEATAALRSGAAVSAVLRLSVTPGPLTQTFVNARP
ncbi:MAG: hypothetical protein AAB225_16850 [Acidobacteriota bacterium]